MPDIGRCALCQRSHDDVGPKCQCMPVMVEPRYPSARCLHDYGGGEPCDGKWMLATDELLICTDGHRWELTQAGWVELNAR